MYYFVKKCYLKNRYYNSTFFDKNTNDTKEEIYEQI